MTESAERICRVLNDSWPSVELKPRPSGSFLDYVEEAVSTALATASTRVDMGDGFSSTSALEIIEDEDGVRFEAMKDQLLEPFAAHINHEETRRLSAAPPASGRLEVEFVGTEAQPLFAGLLIGDLGIAWERG